MSENQNMLAVAQQPAAAEARLAAGRGDHLLSAAEAELVSAAMRARDRAVAPHTGRRQGAAVLCAERVFTGATVESSDPAITVSGLRSAVASAVGLGGRGLREVAVVGADDGDDEADRVFLLEFGPDVVLLVCDEVGHLVTRTTIGQVPPQHREPAGRDSFMSRSGGAADAAGHDAGLAGQRMQSP